MSTTQAATMTCTEPKMRGWGCLPCPKCHEVCSIEIDLEDMTTCTCRECDDEFQLDEMREMIAKWTPVIARLDALFA